MRGSMGSMERMRSHQPIGGEDHGRQGNTRVLTLRVLTTRRRARMRVASRVP